MPPSTLDYYTACWVKAATGKSRADFCLGHKPIDKENWKKMAFESAELWEPSSAQGLQLGTVAFKRSLKTQWIHVTIIITPSENPKFRLQRAQKEKTPLSCQLRVTKNTIHGDKCCSFPSSQPSQIICLHFCVSVGLAHLTLNTHF